MIIIDSSGSLVDDIDVEPSVLHFWAVLHGRCGKARTQVQLLSLVGGDSHWYSSCCLGKGVEMGSTARVHCKGPLQGFRIYPFK